MAQLNVGHEGFRTEFIDNPDLMIADFCHSFVSSNSLKLHAAFGADASRWAWNMIWVQ
ncbi:MAG: hypothetical protein ABJE99_03465 [Roseobacter sp.]